MSSVTALETLGHLGPRTYSIEHLLLELSANCALQAPSGPFIVKSVWYGKKTNSTEHEFILIQIDGEANDGSQINYLVLDRNPFSKLATRTKMHQKLRVIVGGGEAVDTFRISRDGHAEQLLKDCNLHPHRLLARLQFSDDEPLYLHQLAVLAHVVSTQHPRYHTIRWSCFFFTGLFWDCLCRLYPGAILTEHPRNEKGKYSCWQYTVDGSQVESVYKLAKSKLNPSGFSSASAAMDLTTREWYAWRAARPLVRQFSKWKASRPTRPSASNSRELLIKSPASILA